MGLTGAFRGLGITEMLQLIRMAKKSGALRIQLKDGTMQTLFFRAGQLIGVESGSESLGPILLEKGLVSEADLNQAIQLQKTTAKGQPLEQILYDMGEIPKENLVKGLMLQAEQTVGALIHEKGGQVNFQEGAEPTLKLEIALDIQGILMAGAVIADEGDRNAGSEPLGSSTVFTRSVAGSEAFKTKKMELWLDDWKVFLAIDGKRPLEEIATRLKISEENVLACVTTLIERGYVEAVEQEDKRKSVLIIDDSLTIQKMVEMALEKEDLILVTASDGATGLQALAERSPDLILLDVMLPDTNGYRLCREIRSKAGILAEIPIIMLTARDTPQDESLGKHAGATAYMTKPFMPEVLRKTVREALA